MLIDEVEYLVKELEKKNSNHTLEHLLAVSEATITSFSRSVLDFREQLESVNFDGKELTSIAKAEESTISKLIEENARLKDKQQSNDAYYRYDEQLRALKIHIDRLKEETIKLVDRIEEKDRTIARLEAQQSGKEVLQIAELERTQRLLNEAKAELMVENQSLLKQLSKLEMELQTARRELKDSKTTDDYLRIQSKYLEAVEENSGNVKLIRELRQRLFVEQERSRHSINESLRHVETRINHMESKDRVNSSNEDMTVQELKKELERAYEENQTLKDRRGEADLIPIQEELNNLERMITIVKEAIIDSSFDEDILAAMREFYNAIDLKTKLLDARLQINILKSQSKKLTLKVSEKEHLLDQAAQLVAILQLENDRCKEEIARIRTSHPLTRKQNRKS
jgi:hypothetical protein